MAQNRNALILALARRLGIRDPRAALAVASAEGLGGGIGDNGTSFGPWQLHKGGALPRHIPLQRAHQWAWSQPGLLYALAQIKKVAGNLQGPAAINAIVRKFERPAAPGAEIQRALAYYQRGGGGAPRSIGQGVTTPLAPPRLRSAPSVSVGQTLARALSEGQEVSDVLPQLIAARQARRAAAIAPKPTSGLPSRVLPLAGGNIPELFYDPLGAIKGGRSIAPIGGHSDHVHYSAPNPQAMLAAIALARRLGLSARENPYVDPVDPVHVKTSYHYRTFPGRYQGKRLGQGLDVSGSPAQMAQFYRTLAQQGRKKKKAKKR